MIALGINEAEIERSNKKEISEVQSKLEILYKRLEHMFNIEIYNKREYSIDRTFDLFELN